jgi:hypothetical protein
MAELPRLPPALPPAPSVPKRIGLRLVNLFSTAPGSLRRFNHSISAYTKAPLRLIQSVELLSSFFSFYLGSTLLQIEEFAAAIAVFVLLPLAGILQAIGWRGIERRTTLTRFLKTSYVLVVVVICASLILITVERKDNKPWSNLQPPLAAVTVRFLRTLRSPTKVVTLAPAPPQDQDATLALMVFKAHLKRGIELERQNLLDQAISEYKEAIHSCAAPACTASVAEASNRLGKAMLKIPFPTDRATAIWYLYGAAEAEPTNKQFDQDYEQAIAKYQDEPYAHFSNAERLWKKGKRKEAMAEYHVSCDLPPHNKVNCEYANMFENYFSDIEADHLKLSNWLMNHGDRAGADQECHKAIDLAPQDSNAHLCLGTMLAGDANWTAATTELEQAVQLDDSNVDAHVQLGNAYFNLGKKQNAMQEFKTACKLFLKQGDLKNCYWCTSEGVDMPSPPCPDK